MRIAIYPSLQAFYEEDPDGRMRSPEADYGVHWRLEGYPQSWRVSYVQNTGEIYAVHQGMTIHDPRRRTLSYGPLFLLGVVPPDPVPANDYRSAYYRTLDVILEGWPQHCGPYDGLTWLRDRILSVTTQ